MRKDYKIGIIAELLTPLAHFGDERAGTLNLFRREKVIYKNKTVDIPVYSGNAFRAILRRLSAKYYLDTIGMQESKISEKLQYIFLNGGGLSSKVKPMNTSAKHIFTFITDNRFIELSAINYLIANIPFLGLFGCSHPCMIQGLTQGYRLTPICKESETYTGIDSDYSCWDLTNIEFGTRRDDLKTVQSRHICSDKTKDNPVQMKYEYEVLIRGTKLVTDIYVVNASDLMIACMQKALELFELHPFLGGKSNIGFGKCKLQYNKFVDTNIYENYLIENKDMICKTLSELETFI